MFQETLLPNSFGEDLIHLFLVVLSVVVLTISALAYFRKGGARYLSLLLAFTFLTLSQVITLVEVLFLSQGLILLPFVGLHLTHLLDFLMLSSFVLALIKN
jgi:hypothetical protein